MQTILIRSAMYLTKNISATVRKLTRSMMGAGDEVSGAIAARIAEALAAGVAGFVKTPCTEDDKYKQENL
jgi:hypothetical protein